MPITLPSKRIIASYIFDWIAIIGIAAVSLGFSKTSPQHRPFSLVDLNISFPVVKEKISTATLGAVSAIAPAVIIFIVCILFVPGRAASATTPKKLIWRRKLWEWNTGWMGLALSLALATIITQGMKNLFGKPRPCMLARCNPNLDAITGNKLDTFAERFNAEWVLVNYTICQQQDKSFLDDGFKSFPSGHASTSWSGLLYLSLFLCSKFSIGFPFIPNRLTNESTDDPILPSSHRDVNRDAENNYYSQADIPPRNRAAAPPIYLLALPLVPVAVAIYITATRYFQFFHFGIDVLGGAIIGIGSAWFAFRWFHMPVSSGAGWSWGARSRNRAFGVLVGTGGYVGLEGWHSKHQSRRKKTDEEVGEPKTNVDNSVVGPGENGDADERLSLVNGQGGPARAEPHLQRE